MNEKPQYILFRESLLSSIAMDTFSYGILLFAFWVNAEFIGSRLLSAALLVICLMGIFSKALSNSKKFYSKEKLLEYVNTL